MMSAKNFLIVYFVVYVALSVVINMLYGPPGMSHEYLNDYKADHDRYLSVSKSTEYKLHKENEAQHPPANEKLAADFAFADSYQEREAFKEEMHRRHRYDLLFDFLRATMVLVLVVRFGGKPLVRFLDGQIAHVREQLEHAAEGRREAAAREAEAKTKLSGIDAERDRLVTEAQARLATEQERMEQTAEQALSMLAQEQEDRVRNEEIQARRALKKALVEEAIEILVKQYETETTPETEAALVDKFVEQMELVR
jgi:F0F1-type ATP synthase membrane subunit b/b'